MEAMDVIYAELTKIFHRVFGDDSIVLQPQLTAEDVDGWDSLKQAEIVIAVQDRFRIKLSIREIDTFICVGDLAEIIRRKQAV
jgi:acyl carrier protein